MHAERLHSRRNSGFTLLELMIVIVILGILGAIVAPKFMDEPAWFRPRCRSRTCPRR